MPPDRRDGVALLKRAFFKLTQQADTLLAIELARLFVVEIVEHAVGLTGVINRRFVMREVFLQLQIGLVHVIAAEINRCIKRWIVFLLCGEVELGFKLLMLRVDTDLPPLVNQEHADRRIRHRHIAVGQRERQIGLAGLGKQLFRFGARRINVL